ncbi:MAG: flagellar M-ring protein FliF, partial [Armatimonadetes bacterium]|nr:flagellar M-ring protein FliF [Armatimonadota bacterium]
MQDSFLQDLVRRWSALSATGRLALMTGLVAGVGILALAYMWSKRPDFRPLFTNIKASEGSAITQKLREMKVEYEVGDDGETILVPASVLYQTRMELAGAGLPAGGASGGFALFDKTRFQTSPLSEKVTWQRALTEELQMTIGSMEEVDSVRVHLVLPQRELLADDSAGTSASIVLKLKGGASLNPQQVRAIKALVSGSVQNLAKENITIMDTRGTLLSSGDDSTESGGASSLADLQKQQEKALERKTQDMLDRVVGPGMAVVRVALALESNQKVVESETYQPTDAQKNTGVLRSLQTVDEGYTGNGRPVVPATAAGQKASALVSGSTSQSEYKNARKTENYEISNVKEKNVFTPGSIRRMTCAVALSSDLKLNRPALDDITDMVKQTVGADATRKDEVKVAVVPFKTASPADFTEEAKKAEMMDWYMRIGKLTAPVVAVMLFWLLSGIFGRKGIVGAGMPVGRGTRSLAAAGATPAGGSGALAGDATRRISGGAPSQGLDSIGGGGGMMVAPGEI